MLCSMSEDGIVYRSSEDTAKRWGISDRRVRVLCENGQVEGAVRNGKLWRIPPVCHETPRRTGRLLANFILMRSGYLPISIKYENRRAYYDAFTSYHKDGDLVPMLGIFAEREHQRLLEYLSAIG